ncbi:GSCOCG00009895001-RA-CDS [Cotesia congregata]|nr:GSCOCG00009895001-RA-CDS [Cotesia congregata]
MLESHNATNTYNHLAKALNDWNLYDKVIAVVHDNARYMVAAVQDSWEADDDIEISVRCFCHTLQCALKECNLKDCLQRVSAIVGHFKHSNKASTALENAQKKHHLPTHRLISHSPTRWNSAYDMVERLVEQRKAVECVLLDKEITTKEMMKKLLLNESDWTYLRDDFVFSNEKNLSGVSGTRITAVRRDTYTQIQLYSNRSTRLFHDKTTQ